MLFCSCSFLAEVHAFLLQLDEPKSNINFTFKFLKQNYLKNVFWKEKSKIYSCAFSDIYIKQRVKETFSNTKWENNVYDVVKVLTCIVSISHKFWWWIHGDLFRLF